MLLWDRTSGPEQKNSLPIPTPSSGQTPLALTAYSPTGSVLAPPSSLRPEIGLAVEVDRYEHACTRLIQGLSHFDRSSVRDRSRLLASLVALELRVRSALRLGRVPISGESWPRELQRALLDRLSQARAGVQDTLRVAGLEDYLAAARGRVGLEPADPESDRSEAAEPASEFRLLRLGHPSWFRGSVDAREGDLTLNVQRAETHPLGDDPNVLLAGIGLLLFCSLLTWLSTPGRPWRLLTVALLALAATVSLDLNLYAYGALLAFVALGAVVRPTRAEPLGAA
jgi:hypothetical protein